MLQYYDFLINKSSTCGLTICNLIDTQTAPAGANEITYTLTPPATQTSEISSIQSIEVTKFNECDSRFTNIDFTILPLNQDAGSITYGTLTFGTTSEFVTFTHPGYSAYEVSIIDEVRCNVKRGASTIYTDVIPTLTTGAVSHKFEVKTGTISVDPSFFLEDDVVEMVITYTNGVTTTATWQFGAIVGGTIGDPSSPVYDTMVVDSSNVYELDASDCLKLTTDLDSFGDWDGVWSVRLKVNYTDPSGNSRHIITTRCAFVDCDSKCDAVGTIGTLLASDALKAAELALAKQALDYMVDCHDCCAACDILSLYNNRIKGNCKSC